MAKKQPQQSATNRKAANSSNNRQRSGNAAPQKRKSAPAPQQNTKPKRVNKDAAAEAATPGNLVWRLALILCVGLVIFSLLFASVNGGSKIVGITDSNEGATPTPPVATTDPNVNITGSDATPIPPSPTPGVDTTPVG